MTKYKIPAKRKVIKTLRMGNGSVLTGEVDARPEGRKELIAEPQLQDYWDTQGKEWYSEGEPQGMAEGGYLHTPKPWDDLSLSDKSEVMRVAVSHGITTLPEIKDKWNEFAEGGDMDKFPNDLPEVEVTAQYPYEQRVIDTMNNSSPEFFGNTFKDGGYKPSSSIMKDIANWEGSSMKTNRSFEAEARDFNRVIPRNVMDRLSQEQLDALYSYGYNVGMGNLQKRVLPTLTAYTQGRVGAQDVANSMKASRDNEPGMGGLRKRRAWERNMFTNQMSDRDLRSYQTSNALLSASIDEGIKKLNEAINAGTGNQNYTLPYPATAPFNPTVYDDSWTLLGQDEPQQEAAEPVVVEDERVPFTLMRLVEEMTTPPASSFLADYKPQVTDYEDSGQGMYIPSFVPRHASLLDNSWLKKGGYLYGEGGATDNNDEEEGSLGKAYDTFKNSTVGTVASFLPIVGTAMDGIELIRHPSLENAGWFGVGLASDLFGGKVIASLAKREAKASFKKALERGSNIYRDAHGKPIILSPKHIAKSDAAALTLGAIPLSETDNILQYGIDKNQPNDTELADDTEPVYDRELANDTEFGYGEYDPLDPPLGLISDYAKKYGRAEARKHFALDNEEPQAFPERENSNISTTADRSEEYENLMQRTLEQDVDTHKHISNRAYDIPFIPSKTININGNVLSTNQLDSLAKYYGWHNANPQLSQTHSKYAEARPLNINEMIGLAGQQTVFGAVPIGNIGEDYGYTDREMANANYLKAFGTIPAEYYMGDFNYNDNKVNLSTPPLLDAFRYYAQGDYNRGDKNHTKDVNEKGENLWKLPSIQQWWNLSGKYWVRKGEELGKKE